jgi:hypothetical protein
VQQQDDWRIGRASLAIEDVHSIDLGRVVMGDGDGRRRANWSFHRIFSLPTAFQFEGIELRLFSPGGTHEFRRLQSSHVEEMGNPYPAKGN